jgi:hypothetical protein
VDVDEDEDEEEELGEDVDVGVGVGVGVAVSVDLGMMGDCKRQLATCLIGVMSVGECVNAEWASGMVSGPVREGVPEAAAWMDGCSSREGCEGRRGREGREGWEGWEGWEEGLADLRRGGVSCQ